eukprot:265178-Amorphochlora_amoeboformis.AAC.2
MYQKTLVFGVAVQEKFGIPSRNIRLVFEVVVEKILEEVFLAGTDSTNLLGRRAEELHSSWESGVDDRYPSKTCDMKARVIE